MSISDFTEEDRLAALSSAGTGVWRLESEVGAPLRFYGDSYMNYLLGVPDDMSPEDRYLFFIARVHKDDMKMFMEYYAALRETSKAEVVYRYLHPELGTIYVRCGGTRTFYDGKCAKYRGFHQNVNNTIRVEQETKKRLTEQAEMFRLLAFKMMEHSSESSAKIDLNTGDASWFDIDESRPLGTSSYEEAVRIMSENVPEEYREDYLLNASLDNLRMQLKEKDSYSFSILIHRQEDMELRHATYWYYTVDDDHTQVLSIFRDTTDEYMKEKQLAEALLMAKQSNRAKTVFLNNMSHDIRTPMNAIIGFTDLAKKHLEDPKVCRGYLDKIDTSSKHLLGLINEVLDMSRIESGKMQLSLEPCSIKEMMLALDTILQTDARNRGLDFCVDVSGLRDECVICDKLRLNQVLLNCASNSVKFTKEGGSVRIVAEQIRDEFVESGFAKYRFVVADTGIGMSEEFRRRVFEPFSREDNRVGQIQGTGLGMSICKNIVDLMGGNISVESKQDVGTKFTIVVTLPIADEDVHVGKPSVDTKDILKGKKVLLVEDNELNSEIATMLLEEQGAEVEAATNGQEAVDKVKAAPENYYQLILMDVQMPIMNGYEATKAIRALDRADAKSLPIVAMTANAFAEDKRNALVAGMNAHVAKPIDVRVLLETLATIL